jgi:hypothetical protein
LLLGRRQFAVGCDDFASKGFVGGLEVRNFLLGLFGVRLGLLGFVLVLLQLALGRVEFVLDLVEIDFDLLEIPLELIALSLGLRECNTVMFGSRSGSL